MGANGNGEMNGSARYSLTSFFGAAIFGGSIGALVYCIIEGHGRIDLIWHSTGIGVGLFLFIKYLALYLRAALRENQGEG